MNPPLISIIIPVYNAESYLAECVKSILNQLEQDWELILVNDGSRDSSEDICLSFAEKDSRIKYISQKNQGVSSARNAGLRMATGKWLTFVDSDDLLEPFALSVIKAAPHNCDIVIAGFTPRIGECTQMDNNGNIFDAADIRMSILNFAKFKKMYPNCTSIDDYSKWSSCARFYKTHVLKVANIWVPEKLKLGEDLAFCIKVLEHINKVWVNNSKIYYYRPNSTSASRTFRSDRIINTELLIEEIGSTIDIQKNQADFDHFILTALTTCCFSYFADSRNNLSSSQSENQLKELCTKDLFSSAIQRCDYQFLAFGKRNRIKIALTLFLLRHKQYKLLLDLIRTILWRIN